MIRSYRPVRLLGRDRPYRAPGRLIHAQEISLQDGKPYYADMAICGRQPREDADGLEVCEGQRITCERCKERMR